MPISHWSSQQLKLEMEIVHIQLCFLDFCVVARSPDLLLNHLMGLEVLEEEIWEEAVEEALEASSRGPRHLSCPCYHFQASFSSQAQDHSQVRMLQEHFRLLGSL